MSHYLADRPPVPGCYPASASGVQRAIEAHRSILGVQTPEKARAALTPVCWDMLERVDGILARSGARPAVRFGAFAAGLLALAFLQTSVRSRRSPRIVPHGPRIVPRRGRRKKGHKNPKRGLNKRAT